MLKRIVMFALLCVLIVGAKTGGKSYSFSLKGPAVAGGAQLKPGDYRLKVDGAQVVLTDKDGKVIDTNTKLEPAERKFDQTAIISIDSEGAHRIVCIQLGGSSYSVVFE
jgi:hypothetical protein